MDDALKELVRSKAALKRATPQTQRTPGRTDEVRNNAGGYVHEVTDKDRLERLLILGTAANTYYVGAKVQAADALEFITEMIAKNEDLVRDTVVDVSTNNRALRQSTTLFVLAALMCYGKDKAATRAVFNDVVRTATHLFEVCQYVDDIGGWGSAKTKAVAGWFTSKTADQLGYQAVKYRSRAV